MKESTKLEMPTGETVHDAKYDVLKFILSFFVVAIHTSLFPMVLFPWLRSAVPLFFIITGYFLFKKLNGITDRAVRLKIVKKFALRNLKLYFFWFICLCPLIIFIRRDILFADGVAMSVFAMLKMILFGSTFTGSWYIMSSILGVLILFFAFDKVPTKVLFFCSLVLYAFLALTSSYPSILRQSDVIASFLDGYTDLFGSPTLTFPVAMVWLLCGKCFAEECFRLRKTSYIMICVVSAVLLYAEWHFVQRLNGTFRNDCYLFLLPFCFGLFGWVHSLGPVYAPGSIHLKGCSTVIYAMHGAVNRLDGAFYRTVLHIDSELLCFITTSVVCVAAYFVITMLLRRSSNRIIRLLRYAY